MKKNFMPLAKKTARSAFALSLAATMVVPAGVSVAADEKKEEAGSVVVVPEPIKTIDFENGLKGVQKDFPGLSITKSAELYVQKSADEVEANEKVDANGLVYTGGGADARYWKTLVSNQPTTAWDDVKGTVLKIGKSYTVPAIYKNKSAGTDNADTTAALDKELPYVLKPATDEAVTGGDVTGGAVTGGDVTGGAVTGEAVTGEAVTGEAVSGEAASQTLGDEATADGVLVQEEYIANSEIVIDNPYGSEELQKELQEFSEYDNPEYDVTWIKYRGKYQPHWQKGLTMSYWIKVPADENGLYKPSSALRWELLDQEYYQADDYGKYLACSYYSIEAEAFKNEYGPAYAEAGLDYETERKKNESKVIYNSDYYFKYAEVEEGQTDADGAPVAKMYAGSGYKGPVYDNRYFDKSVSANEEEESRPHVSAYYAYNPVYQRGYLLMADGSRQAQAKEYADSYYAKYSSLDPEQGSDVRSAFVDGELQIDVDNSIFWVPDNNLGIQKNPNRTDSYGQKQGMNNGDVFFMNSWQSGTKKDAAGNGTYQSSKTQAISPVTSIDENGKSVKNGNCDTWHQVTVTLQNDWVEFYVDGVCANVDETYSSRGLECLDNKKSFKRLNKGTGLRYGWGSEKDAINFSYGNYVCRVLMDWITDEEATLHIGGAGMYADEYAQATGSCEFSIDDLKFYGELLSPEQIVAAYDQEVADMNKVAAITGTAVDVNHVDVTVATDVSIADPKAKDETKAAVTTNESVTIEGKSIDNVIKVAANEKKTTATGAKVANPFAGKNLEGATVAYWVKQSDKEYNSMLSFIDAPKYVNNPKGNGADASSILYVQNNGVATFTEGYSDADLATKLGNACSTASDATGAAAIADKTASDWTYVTVTMTNAGIKYYINGELVENLSENPAGARFLDGYYTRVKDEANIQKKYGMFGGTNNQGASTLMGFLTADDTELYLGFSPDKGGMMYSKTSECSFADVKTVDAALTDAEVKALYEDRFNNGSQAEVVLGDLTGEGTVGLDDAQTVLKIALKLKSDATDAQMAAADVNNDGSVDLKDAQLILKYALKLIKNF